MDLLRPSKTKRLWWCQARPRLEKLDIRTSTTKDVEIGKWLIFEHRRNIDSAWDKIRKATEDGILSLGSKVSTRKKKSERFGGDGDEHVICVYTFCTDEDKEKVRKALNQLGFVRHLHYKTDADTFAGIYSSPVKGSNCGSNPSNLSFPSFSTGLDSLNKDFTQPMTGNASEEPSESSGSGAEWSTISGNVSVASASCGVKRKSVFGDDIGTSDYSPKKMWSPIKYIKMHLTRQKGKKGLLFKIQQQYPESRSSNEVIMPLSHLLDVMKGVHLLSNTLPPPEGDLETRVEGVKTSEIEVWAQRCEVYEGKFTLFFHSLKTKKIVMFPQDDGIFYYKGMEYWRQRPDAQLQLGKEEFSSDESVVSDDEERGIVGEDYELELDNEEDDD